MNRSMPSVLDQLWFLKQSPVCVGLELGCLLISPVLGMQVFAPPGQHSLSIVKLPGF